MYTKKEAWFQNKINTKTKLFFEKTKSLTRYLNMFQEIKGNTFKDIKEGAI